MWKFHFSLSFLFSECILKLLFYFSAAVLWGYVTAVVMFVCRFMCEYAF